MYYEEAGLYNVDGIFESGCSVMKISKSVDEDWEKMILKGHQILLQSGIETRNETATASSCHKITWMAMENERGRTRVKILRAEQDAQWEKATVWGHTRRTAEECHNEGL